MPLIPTTLRLLYFHQHKSMAEIANILHCSIHKVEYWMNKYDLSRRNQSDANYHKYNPQGDPFRIKINLTHEESNLLFLALGLFWGEGNKVSKEGIRIGNSDPELIKQWCLFIRQICQVKESKIHFHLQTFRDNDINIAKKFWSTALNIDESRITTGTPTKPLGKGSYTKISQYGVITVGVYNTHFRTWMMEQLRKLGYNS